MNFWKFSIKSSWFLFFLLPDLPVMHFRTVLTGKNKLVCKQQTGQKLLLEQLAVMSQTETSPVAKEHLYGGTLFG